MKIRLTDDFLALLARKDLTDKTLILIADDGGGKYSLQGGACTIGTKFSLIVTDKPDSDYPVLLENEANIALYTSDYDLLFLEKGLTLDFVNNSIRLSDTAHAALDNAVQIATAKEVLEAFKKGILFVGKTC